MRCRLALAICGLCLLAALLSGCETVRGGVRGAAKGGAEGFCKDWENAQKIDSWMRENLW
jgi:predicted small secreted protein